MQLDGPPLERARLHFQLFLEQSIASFDWTGSCWIVGSEKWPYHVMLFGPDLGKDSRKGCRIVTVNV